MPLFDYICRGCGHRFEQIVRSKDDSEAGTCPKCARTDAEAQIARFRVGGRGDLRETTDFHGCHPAVETESHVHGSGCGHGGSSEES
jgi:putative FmdB family regulatory protein